MKHVTRAALLIVIIPCALPVTGAIAQSQVDIPRDAATVIPVQPLEAPPPGELPLSLDGCQWVWHPGDHATVAAPTIHVIFTGTITLPDNDSVARAEFLLHADDLFTLTVNGQVAGQGGLNGLIPNPEKPAEEHTREPEPCPLPTLADMTGMLKPGANHISIRVINTMPSTPAGLIGRWRVRMTSGAVITGEIDRNWKARRNISKVTVGVETLVPFGQAPWDRVPGSLPAPGPFLGSWTQPSTGPDTVTRLVVDTACDGMTATINDNPPVAFEKGSLGIDITQAVREGENRVRIEPCAPARVRVELVPAHTARPEAASSSTTPAGS